ncbi:PKD domain-containing protein [Dyadobacter sp. CY261]|uniref:PKD domain-containing protein n=1 Tax=Dyadobacter sp. CY261 TaxID=2907203 RepID=UPI001F2EF0E9|nr:PKD domain-containing protein [Dyadobacter sp. CY261]MCF0072202.1 PKD domain-containing protein [Dyadobacter sp. CY261]
MRYIKVVLLLAMVISSCKKDKQVPVPAEEKISVCFTLSPVEDFAIDSLITFTNCSDSVGVAYEWNFGDGNTNSGRHTTHAYTEPGEYEVKLAVSRPGTTPVVLNKKIVVRIKERYVDLLSITKPTDFAEARDGSIYVMGNTNDKTDAKLYLSKFDKNLRLRWTKYWSDSHSTVYRKIDVAPDGGLLMAGSWDEYDYRGPLCIMKTDSTGNVEWTKSYPLDMGVSIDIRSSSDGGIIIIAEEEGDLEGYGIKIGFTSMIKLNADGTLSWRKVFNKERFFGAGNILPLPDGYQFAASGTSLNGCANCYDSLVVLKTDFSGKLILRKSRLRAPMSAVGGTYMAATENYIFTNGPGPAFTLLDATGKFSNEFPIPSDHSNWVSSTSTGHFVTGSGFTHWNGLLLTLFDETGVMKWTKRLGRRNKTCFPERGFGTFASQLKDNSILFVGTSYKDCPNEQESSMYLVKVNENGDIL